MSELLESKSKFLEALMYELVEFGKGLDPEVKTRSEWFEDLMEYFEFSGLTNMKEAVMDYNNVQQELSE